MDIIIVGGSLTGLIHGILLKSLGHNVRILEQWSEQVRHGEAAGIRAGPCVQDFFRRFDRTEEPFYLDCPGLNFIDQAGQQVRFIDSPMAMTAWTTLYFRLRANFDGFTSEHSPVAPDTVKSHGRATYELGKKVVNLAPDSNGVMLTVRDVKDGRESRTNADMVIAADGSHSTVRNLLLPKLQRPYAGYVAWRGGVPAAQLSQATIDTCRDNFTVFKMEKNYILVYKIPGMKSSLEKESVVYNWVWYSNTTELELSELLRDSNGHTHNRTLPPGLIRPEVWEQQVHFAEDRLPAAFIELVQKTQEPFISAVSNTVAPKASFFDGKVLVVGDALAQFRPHVALSANQAAYDALELEKVLKGEQSMQQWEKNVLQYGKNVGALSVMIGDWTQFGIARALISAVRYVWICTLGKLGL